MSNFELATNPNTPTETLDRLSYDKDSWVRQGVAMNSNTPPGTIERLSYDKSWGVRCEIA